MGIHDCLQGPRVYKLGLVIGQHINIIAIILIGDTNIITRFRAQQLRIAVLVRSVVSRPRQTKSASFSR